MNKWIYRLALTLILLILGAFAYFKWIYVPDYLKQGDETNWPTNYRSDEEAKAAIADCEAHLTNNKNGIPVEVVFESKPPEKDELRYVSLSYRKYNSATESWDPVKDCLKGTTKFYIPEKYRTHNALEPFVDTIIFNTDEKKYKMGRYATLNSFDLTTAPSWKLVILKDRSHEHRVDIDMVPAE